MAEPFHPNTPRTDKLEELRVELRQHRTPAYGDALRLCRAFEQEVARLTACLAKANEGFEQFERKSFLQADRIEQLEASLRDAVGWVEGCVNDVLYPLSHETSQNGKNAEGYGGASVAIVTQAKHVLSSKVPD